MLADQVRYIDQRTESKDREPPEAVQVNAFRIREIRIRVHPRRARKLELTVESGDFFHPEGEPVAFVRSRQSTITPDDPRWALFFGGGLGGAIRDRCLALARSDGHVPPPEDSTDVPEV